ncbi:MAG: hypothetical protein JXR46_12585 [Calditrichaceae bacterium]|nr:hypothetical protein [Calditrichaceae bacterium]MBN2709873.1 hypothetical protein [Calditrichaceae bacterium]
MKNKKHHRKEHESPYVISELGWKYHHLGIPTETSIPGERYLEEYGMYVSGFESSPYGIEWMRFEEGSPLSEIIQTLPHIAFEVDDLDREIKGKELIGEITSPMEGVRSAMIKENGAPIELIEFKRK